MRVSVVFRTKEAPIQLEGGSVGLGFVALVTRARHRRQSSESVEEDTGFEGEAVVFSSL